MERLKGYKKIKHSGGSLITCELYNPATKDLKRVIVDDMEYQYGDGLINRDYPMEVLEAIRSMPIDDNTLYQYNIDQGIPCVGAKIEVVKGRKYPKGQQGKIINMYDYKDCYGRYVTTYCITDNGMKITTNNIKVI